MSLDSDLSFEELKDLRRVGRAVDDLLEQSLKARESLQQCFARLFPPLLTLTGARGVVINTRDEDQNPATYAHGDFAGEGPGAMLDEVRWGARRLPSGRTFVSQELDLVGHSVGSFGLLFDGDRTAEAAQLTRLLDLIAEQLDTVLATVQTASEKQGLVVAINHSLANRVFETGMDAAVRALCERVKVPGFLVLYRDALEQGALHYRSYEYGQLKFASNGTHDARLEAAIRAHGQNLILPSDHSLQSLLGARAMETVLIGGSLDGQALGKIMVASGGDGFSAYTMDLLRVLASTLSQRLVDYNRERIHLSQFFGTATIDELLKDPDYNKRYLQPRAEEVGIVFADINGFTRICEQVLQRPERIGKFVDDWSEEAVRILHRYDGVFDKMVGDCIIGLWGPPFFKSSRAERAEAAVRAAVEIQSFTRESMSAHPEIAQLTEVLKMPGLGVAIGVNLTPSFCGLFGPNRNYTSFSTGMNQTARLQSLGAFRETLVMDSVVEALDGTEYGRSLRFGPLQEATVKNVAAPLKYHRLLG